MTAAAVRKLLDSEASDEALATAVEEARQQLAAHFQVHANSGRCVGYRIADVHLRRTLVSADAVTTARHSAHVLDALYNFPRMLCKVVRQCVRMCGRTQRLQCMM